MPPGWRVARVTGFGVLLFGVAVLILDPDQWRLSLTEMAAGLVLLCVAQPSIALRRRALRQIPPRGKNRRGGGTGSPAPGFAALPRRRAAKRQKARRVFVRFKENARWKKSSAGNAGFLRGCRTAAPSAPGTSSSSGRLSCSVASSNTRPVSVSTGT